MRRRFVFLLIMAVVLDRVIKSFALSGIHGSWWIAQFVLFKNNHLVFSLPLSNTFSVLLMSLAIIAVLWLARRSVQRTDMISLFATLLILSGAISNLFDRLRFGFVIDWAYFGPWWPVFNLADVMIAVGVIMLVLSPRAFDKKTPI